MKLRVSCISSYFLQQNTDLSLQIAHWWGLNCDLLAWERYLRAGVAPPGPMSWSKWFPSFPRFQKYALCIWGLLSFCDRSASLNIFPPISQDSKVLSKPFRGNQRNYMEDKFNLSCLLALNINNLFFKAKSLLSSLLFLVRLERKHNLSPRFLVQDTASRIGHMKSLLLRRFCLCFDLVLKFGQHHTSGKVFRVLSCIGFMQ